MQDGTEPGAFTNLLRRQRILPVLRSRDASEALVTVRALADSGCEAVELTTSILGWEGALEQAATLITLSQSPLTIGLGTVTTRAQAQMALKAGADFLVSPFAAPEVRAVADELGAMMIEGGLTPGEVAGAGRSGIAKVFPAHVGGAAYVRSLRAVLPDLELIPTGGISVTDVQAYLDAGALAVGVGSGLPSDHQSLVSLFGARGCNP